MQTPGNGNNPFSSSMLQRKSGGHCNNYTMKAIYFRHDCVFVKDQHTIKVLQKSGLGARVLNPIITLAESVEAEGTSPLLLLDEEVNV